MAQERIEWPVIEINPETKGRWSGKPKGYLFPPHIGQVVEVSMNNLGLAKVVGYKISHDYIGLEVLFLSPPEWWLKQNKPDTKGVVFGMELKSII